MAGSSDTDNGRRVKPAPIAQEGDRASAARGEGQPSPGPAAGVGPPGGDGKRLNGAERIFEAGDKTQDA